MEQQTFADELRHYLYLLRRWAWLLVAATLAAGFLVYYLSLRATPVYRASTRLLVNQAPATKSTDYASLLTSERLARTYAELLATHPVLETVAENLALEQDADKLGEHVQVELVRDTQLIDLHVEDTDAQRAAAIANEIVTVFSLKNQAIQAERYTKTKESLAEQIAQVDAQIQETSDALAALDGDEAQQLERDRLEAILSQYRQTYASLLQSYEQVRVSEANTTSNVVPVEQATAPQRPVRPRPLRYALIAAALALGGAIGLALLIEALDDTLGPDDVQRHLGLPVLGVIARHQAHNGQPVVAAQPRSPSAEAFRALRTNLQFASVDRSLTTILVTSPSPRDGKSTIAVNLGASLAQSGRKVVLVDADLRRPQVHEKLGLANRMGMSDLFVQPEIALNGCLQDTPLDQLRAITAGTLPPNPSELLGSAKMSQILSALQQSADMTIIDSPPVMAVTDAAVLSSRVDGVLLVIKPGETRLAACKQAVEQLQRVGAQILGVVLNDVEVRRSRYRYANYNGYYYAYHKYYGSDGERGER